MREYLTNASKLTLVVAGQADGQGDPAGTGLNMAGFDGVLFVLIAGTITGSGTITMAAEQSSDDAATDDYTALTGASAQAVGSADSDLLLVVDVIKPSKQYVRVQITRAVANSVIGGVLAIQYMADEKAAATASAQLAAAIVQVAAPAEA